MSKIFYLSHVTELLPILAKEGKTVHYGVIIEKAEANKHFDEDNAIITNKL